jgi:protein dithiol:quinone oxidoreductase
MNKFFELVEWRSGWALLSASAFILFGVALYFQHIMNLQPCVMCIEERLLILSLGLVSLIPLINPRFISLRVIGYVGIIGIAYIGYDLAAEHVVIQKGEGFFMASCSIFPRLPEWLPLYEWSPKLFMPTGNCGDISWTFAGLTMVEWVKNIFIFYMILPIFMVLSRRRF